MKLIAEKGDRNFIFPCFYPFLITEIESILMINDIATEYINTIYERELSVGRELNLK